jgi:hypothetical protein
MSELKKGVTRNGERVDSAFARAPRAIDYSFG